MKDLIKKSPLISYFVIAYAVTWIALLPLVLNLPVSPHWHFLGAFGPAVSAFLVTYLTRGKEGVRELKGRCLKINVGAICAVSYSKIRLSEAFGRREVCYLEI